MDEKILFRDMSLQEQRTLISIWKTMRIRRISYHTREKMERLGITMEMIEETLRVNHIIEYKLKDGKEVRMVLRGVKSYPLKYEWKKYDNTRDELEYGYCNICLVVNAFGDVVTVYNSPDKKTTKYRSYRGDNEGYLNTMNENLRKNLVKVASITNRWYNERRYGA